MKRTLLTGLSVTLAALLLHAALNRPAHASGEILCRQMAGCTSPNVCMNGIVGVEDCVMQCAGGGAVYCEKMID